jgi:hypothetical protein
MATMVAFIRGSSPGKNPAMASIRADASRSSPNAWVKAPVRSFPKPRAERSDAASTDRVTCRSRFPGRPGEFPGIPVARPGLGWHAVRPLAQRPNLYRKPTAGRSAGGIPQAR